LELREKASRLRSTFDRMDERRDNQMLIRRNQKPATFPLTCSSNSRDDASSMGLSKLAIERERRTGRRTGDSERGVAARPMLVGPPLGDDDVVNVDMNEERAAAEDAASSAAAALPLLPPLPRDEATKEYRRDDGPRVLLRGRLRCSIEPILFFLFFLFFFAFLAFITKISDTLTGPRSWPPVPPRRRPASSRPGVPSSVPNQRADETGFA